MNKLKNKIDKVYSTLDGYNVNKSGNITPKNVVETYGELTIEGFNKLLGDNSWKGYNFYDLGSGVGKVVIYSHLLKDFDKSVGVEFNKERHNKAKTAQRKLTSKIKIKKHRKTRKTNKQKLIFNRGTMFNKKYFDNKKNSVYFISNLCFTEEMNKQLTEYFNKYRVKPGLKTIIFCSKELPNLKFTSKDTLSVQMTWSNDSQIYKYLLN